MVINVEKISKEIIQPSSPTPPHLRTMKLSFLDQLLPIVWIPIVAFYDVVDQNPNINHFERSRLLKKSLAETLTRFYPLAGTLNGDFSVNCNDQGVKYFEAKVPCKLSEVVENCDLKVLLQFLPFNPHVTSLDEAGSRGLLAVQYNIFDCGGVAISICLSHQIADGSSAAMFLNAWAATSRGDSEAIYHPSFDASIHFPPRDNMTARLLSPENVVTRRFVFNKSSIDALKEQASSSSSFSSADDGCSSQVVKPPTRVEALSTFIWKRVTAVAQSKPVKPKLSAAMHAVNIRERLNPPLSNCFGNLWLSVIATLPIDDIEKDYDSVVSHVGNAIRQFNDEHVKKVLDGDQYLISLKEKMELILKGELGLCGFSSWVRFPIYDVNFGWGKPTWVTAPGIGSSSGTNFVVLMRARDGDGIEAWVHMTEDEMAMFQRDPELLLFVSPAVN